MTFEQACLAAQKQARIHGMTLYVRRIRYQADTVAYYVSQIEPPEDEHDWVAYHP